MRIAFLLAILLAAGTTRADLSAYANLDSISYDGIFFIGGTDRQEYAYLDSIRVIFVVENPTGAPYFWFPLMLCEGAGLGELWCPSPEAPEVDCVPMSHDDRECHWLIREGVLEVFPGMTVLYEATIPPFHDFVIPPDWSFRRGHAVFEFPYQPPFWWQLTVPYTRRDPTPIDRKSWTAIKLLYR